MPIDISRRDLLANSLALPIGGTVSSGFAVLPSAQSLFLAHPDVDVKLFQTLGFKDPGDRGGATYVRVESEPVHAGKIRAKDGTWWEIASEEIYPEALGAFGDGADRTAELKNWLEVLGIRGALGRVGIGQYAFSDDLILHSASVLGSGSLTVFKALRPDRGTIVLTGETPSLRKCVVISTNSHERLQGASCVRVMDAFGGWKLSSVDVKRAASSGISVSRSTDGCISNCTATDTFADGLNISGGSKRIVVQNWLARDCGDDGAAVVSYQSDGDICEDITFVGGLVENVGRGWTVVGGRRVRHLSVTSRNTFGAGVYYASERKYNTFGCSGCWAQNPIVIEADRGGLGQAGVQFDGRSGHGLTRHGEAISNEVSGCGSEAPNVSYGFPTLQAAIAFRDYSRNCTVSQLTAENSPGSAIFNNGADNSVNRVYINNIAGRLAVVGAKAQGSFKINDAVCNSLFRAGADGGLIKVISGSAIELIHIEGLTIRDMNTAFRVVEGEEHIPNCDVIVRDISCNNGRIPEFYKQRIHHHSTIDLTDTPGISFQYTLRSAVPVGGGFRVLFRVGQRLEISWNVRDPLTNKIHLEKLDRWRLTSGRAQTGTVGVDWIQVADGLICQRWTETIDQKQDIVRERISFSDNIIDISSAPLYTPMDYVVVVTVSS